MRCPHSLLSEGLNCSNVSSGKYREWIEVRVYDVTKNVQAPPGTSGIFWDKLLLKYMLLCLSRASLWVG